MKSQIIKIKFRAVNRDIFQAIRDGKKKVETRAATDKYRKVEIGDVMEFVCGKDRFTKEVRSVEIFKTIGALLKKYEPQQISPNIKTEKEIREMWYSFPGYEKRLKNAD